MTYAYYSQAATKRAKEIFGDIVHRVFILEDGPPSRVNGVIRRLKQLNDEITEAVNDGARFATHGELYVPTAGYYLLHFTNGKRVIIGSSEWCEVSVPEDTIEYVA